jgi:hypothetical protein
VSNTQRPSDRDGQLSDRERIKIEGRFGLVLLLLIVSVFFSISAPDEPWVWLLIMVVFAANFSIVMLASGVRRTVVRVWLGVAQRRRRQHVHRYHAAAECCARLKVGALLIALAKEQE